MFRRVLVPIDFGSPSKDMMRLIEEWASRFEPFHVTILHVAQVRRNVPIHAGLPVGNALVGSTTEVVEQATDEAQGLLKEAASMLQQTGMHHQTELLWGDPVTEICRYAENEEMDLVVVGRKDKGPLERLLMGSVSKGVVESAPCHVFVVKQS